MIKTKEELKKFRLSLGKTQDQFSRDLGVSLSYYGKVESGRLAFYEGIKKSVNDLEAKIKAYEKATTQYIEVQKKVEDKGLKIISGAFYSLIFFSLIMILILIS